MLARQPDRTRPISSTGEIVISYSVSLTYAASAKNRPDRPTYRSTVPSRSPSVAVLIQLFRSSHPHDNQAPVEYEEIVSHDTKHAIVNHAKSLNVDALMRERYGEQIHMPVFGSDSGWIKRHAPCDVIDIATSSTDSTYSIDSTHVEAIQYNDAASWNYDPTAEKYYYGFGCTIVLTGAKTPIAAEFT